MVPGRPGPIRPWTKRIGVLLAYLVLFPVLSAGKGDGGVGRELLARELGHGTFSVFSVLHDPNEGLVRVFAEVYPVEVCHSVSSCTFSIHGAARETLSVAASWDVPFTNLTTSPELRECFVRCSLPQTGLKLAEVKLENRDGLVLATWAVEEVDRLPEGKAKGVGMCVGPIFSSTPTALDWLQYYAELGVSGIHMYAIVADFVLKPSKYMHEPGSLRPVSFEHHHLVTWRAFHPSKWSAHYYGQWLIYNDCVFRTRHLYEYVMFHDRDEFAHFVGLTPKKVNLMAALDQLFGAKDVAGITYWGALYHTHCHMQAAGLVGSRKAHTGEEVQVQVHSGYDVWEADTRAPDFTGCTAKSCHAKSIIRPFGVDVMNVHHFERPAAGFQPEYKLASPEVLFTKHLRCLFRHGTSSWETDTSKPLCSDEEVLHPDPRWGGVPVCPVSVVQDVRARNNVTAQPGG